MTRWLAIDTGDERTGLAAGSDETRLAVPLGIVAKKGRSLDRVAAEIAEQARSQAAEALIVGLPLNADGSEGIQARRARALGRRITAATGLPTTYWDERMSSFIAEQRPDGIRPGSRRRMYADDLAAAVILQSYFDAAARPSPGSQELLEVEQ